MWVWKLDINVNSINISYKADNEYNFKFLKDLTSMLGTIELLDFSTDNFYLLY